MSRLVVLLVLVAFVSAGPNEDTVDLALAGALNKHSNAKAPNFDASYPRPLTAADIVFSVQFSDGVVSITALTREGDVSVAEDGKLGFSASLEAVAKYNYKLVAEKFPTGPVSTGSATVRWTNNLQGVLSKEDCKVTLDNSSKVSAVKVHLDIEPSKNYPSFTAHPTLSEAVILKALDPALRQLITDSLNGVSVC